MLTPYSTRWPNRNRTRRASAQAFILVATARDVERQSALAVGGLKGLDHQLVEAGDLGDLRQPRRAAEALPIAHARPS